MQRKYIHIFYSLNLYTKKIFVQQISNKHKSLNTEVKDDEYGLEKVNGTFFKKSQELKTN